nr:EpsG family protein [Providencia rettgeri]
MDWAIYFGKFKSNEEAFSSFEPGFVIFFKILLFFSSENFGLTIVYFYSIAFGILLSSLSKYKANEPFFIAILIIVCGHTLILEQLRQFLACLIVFPSIIEYQKNSSLKKLSFRVIFAALFHASALILLPVILLCRIKKQHLFILSSILSVLFIIILLINGHHLLFTLGDLNFIFIKLSYYLEKNPITIQMGWQNLFTLTFIVTYILTSEELEANDNKLFLRIIFVGATILTFSGMVLFFNRFSFYFIFIIIYLASSHNHTYGKNKKSQRAKKIIIFSYFSLFVSLNFLSYFRNDLAPIKFDNLDLHFFELFDDNYLQIHSEIILSKQVVGNKWTIWNYYS